MRCGFFAFDPVTCPVASHQYLRAGGIDALVNVRLVRN